MPIERQKHLYEILVRLGPDGFRGAHAVDLERVVDIDAGEVLAERELPARPLTETEAATAIGAENARLVVELASVVAERDAARARVAELEAEAP